MPNSNVTTGISVLIMFKQLLHVGKFNLNKICEQVKELKIIKILKRESFASQNYKLAKNI